MQNISKKSRHWQAFLYALGIAAVVFLPFVIFDGGYFIYYGDFNVQQIPFYKLVHESVRAGDVFWNWYTDLGANFIGSYSFYMLFSPFFWITLPFPTTWLPFMMAPLLVLKTACASLIAYLYLERFLKDNRYAVIGALLYAFSGWMDFNIFFNHFHDVAVFFPLLLLALETLVMDGKKGFFTIAVFINCMVNYWFFIGEAVFIILYFIVRMTDTQFRIKMSAPRFLQIALEALLGAACSAFSLIPSLLAILGNPRTGFSELLTGWNFWLYWHEQRPPAIIQSFFFPPELPARPNFFPDHGAKWASLSAWLPLFGMTGVFAYFFQRKNDWVKKILLLSLIISLIPGLNSLFILLNQSYYARWFYMPILLMALASVRALEDAAYDMYSFKRSFRWCMLITLVFVTASGLTPNFDAEGALKFGMAEDPMLLWIYAAFAVAGILITAMTLLKFRGSKYFLRISGIAVAVFSVVFTVFFIANGKNNFERSQFVINTGIKGREIIDLPEEPFARSDAYDAMDNLLMFWHLPNIQAFHSIVPPSIMEFYPEIGEKRDVGSRPETETYAIRPLLSVRWLFIQSDKEKQEPMPGYRKYSERAGYNIYENENYIPMGFTYDNYLSVEDFKDLPMNHRDNAMLKAIVLEDGAIRRNMDILEPLETLTFTVTEKMLAEDSIARALHTAYDFTRDNMGFSAKTDFEQSRLVFFSVPWEGGWSATVNGAPVLIEKANIGFMAVRVPAGYAEIRFDYMTPGIYEGILITGVACVILLIYILLAPQGKKREKITTQQIRSAIVTGKTVTITANEYKELFDAKERAENLQRTLNEAAATRIDFALPPEEQTLRFVETAEDVDGQ